MGVEFFQTAMGQRYYEGTLPSLVKAIKEQTEAIRENTEALEKIAAGAERKEISRDRAVEILCAYVQAERDRDPDDREFDHIAVLRNVCKCTDEELREFGFMKDLHTYYDTRDDTGWVRSIVFTPDTGIDEFLRMVSHDICFEDCSPIQVERIVFRDRVLKYVGWQPGMLYEYEDSDGNVVWSCRFPEWDH